MTPELIQLLLIYQIKHFLADFPLQTPYMLGKFKSGTEWIPPLLAHAGMHGFFTLMIATAFLFDKPWGISWGLAFVDFAVHFVVDRIKASPVLLGRYKALSANDFLNLKYLPTCVQETKLKSNRFFWWSLGWDQMMHHLTHYYIIYRILSV